MTAQHAIARAERTELRKKSMNWLDEQLSEEVPLGGIFRLQVMANQY